MRITYGKGFDFTPTLSMPGKVLALQNELLKMPQANIVTEHTFMPGIYERKITIPAWTIDRCGTQNALVRALGKRHHRS